MSARAGDHLVDLLAVRVGDVYRGPRGGRVEVVAWHYYPGLAPLVLLAYGEPRQQRRSWEVEGELHGLVLETRGDGATYAEYAARCQVRPDLVEPG